MTTAEPAKKTMFNRDFAPHEGLVKSVEKTCRDEICLNGLWKFKIANDALSLSRDSITSPVLPPDKGWESVSLKIPSPWNINGFSDGGGGDFRSYPSYPNHWNEAKAGWLRKTVAAPDDWAGNRVILHFEAVAGFAKVYVNKKEVGENFDPFLPCRFDVTDWINPGEELEIILWVAHGSLLDDRGKYGYRPYVSGSFFGSYIAGIWQDVYLQKIPSVYVVDTFVQPQVSTDILEVEVTVKNTTESALGISIDGAVHRWVKGSGNSLVEAP